MKMKSKTLVCLGFISVAFFLAFLISPFYETAKPDQWPMFHHDLSHTGASNSDVRRTNQTLWKFNTGGQVGSPVVVDGVVYVGSFDHKVYAFKASSGDLIWNYTTNGIVVSRPVVAESRVYVGSEDKNLYCLSASDGTLVWNYTTGYYVDSDPAVSD